MGCGCGKRRQPRAVDRAKTDGRALAAATPTYEVVVDGRPTGRRFTSLLAAQTVAARLGGQVRAL